MTKTISAVGFEFEKKQSELIESKMKRISYADDLIVDLMLRVKRAKSYSFDATVNFRWGNQSHVTSEDFDFSAGLNKLMDTLDTKIQKEKEKIQDHTK
ncbi:MAG: HPF/RaiA family ribosome-associated protein [Treponema sp.]|nr:HPF/RaiA family ribosome-associated protein [Treponema sp.]